jgi:hypothetical protein
MPTGAVFRDEDVETFALHTPNACNTGILLVGHLVSPQGGCFVENHYEILITPRQAEL